MANMKSNGSFPRRRWARQGCGRPVRRGHLQKRNPEAVSSRSKLIRPYEVGLGGEMFRRRQLIIPFS